MEIQTTLVEMPSVTIKNDIITIHNYVTPIGNKIVLNRAMAALLYIELHKFILSDTKNELDSKIEEL